MDQNKRGSYRECLKEIWKTRVWLLFLTRCILCAGLFCAIPLLQTELTDYFLHKHTDKDMKCTGHHGPPKHLERDMRGEMHGDMQEMQRGVDGDFHGDMHGEIPGEIPGDFHGDMHGEIPGEMHGGPPHVHHGPPEECIKAHTDVLIWTTGRTLFSALTVSLFLNPAVGTWSDMYGRKPFLIYSYFAGLVPFGVVYLYLKTGLPLWWYFISHFVSSPFSSQSILLAYIADVITMESRLLAFGLLTLMLSVGIIIGTGLTLGGAVGNLETACIVGAILTLISSFIVVFFVPESVSPDVQQKARRTAAEKRANSSLSGSLAFCWTSFAQAVKILWRTPFFRKLTIIMFIVSIVSEEYIEFKTQYLQEVLHFGTKEQSIMIMIMGVAGFVILTFGMWIVRSLLKLSDKSILTLGTIALAASFALLAACMAPWMAYLSTALVSFWMFLSMAISSMKSVNVEPEAQGAVQGALTAISSIGFGLGPLLFLGLYIAFRHGSVYIPGAPFYFGFLLLIVTVCLSISLKPPAHSDPSNISIEKCDETDPLIPSTSNSSEIATEKHSASAPLIP